MSEDGKTFTITFNTTAAGNGAEQTRQDINDVDAAAQQAAQSLEILQSASSAAQGEIAMLERAKAELATQLAHVNSRLEEQKSHLTDLSESVKITTADEQHLVEVITQESQAQQEQNNGMNASVTIHSEMAEVVQSVTAAEEKEQAATQEAASAVNTKSKAIELYTQHLHEVIAQEAKWQAQEKEGSHASKQNSMMIAAGLGDMVTAATNATSAMEGLNGVMGAAASMISATGPWGIAIGVGINLLGGFIQKLDAANKEAQRLKLENARSEFETLVAAMDAFNKSALEISQIDFKNLINGISQIDEKWSSANKAIDQYHRNAQLINRANQDSKLADIDDKYDAALEHVKDPAMRKALESRRAQDKRIAESKFAVTEANENAAQALVKRDDHANAIKEEEDHLSNLEAQKRALKTPQSAIAEVYKKEIHDKDGKLIHHVYTDQQIALGRLSDLEAKKSAIDSLDKEIGETEKSLNKFVPEADPRWREWASKTFDLALLKEDFTPAEQNELKHLQESAPALREQQAAGNVKFDMSLNAAKDDSTIQTAIHKAIDDINAFHQQSGTIQSAIDEVTKKIKELRAQDFDTPAATAHKAAETAQRRLQHVEKEEQHKEGEIVDTFQHEGEGKIHAVEAQRKRAAKEKMEQIAEMLETKAREEESRGRSDLAATDRRVKETLRHDFATGHMNDFVSQVHQSMSAHNEALKGIGSELINQSRSVINYMNETRTQMAQMSTELANLTANIHRT